LSDLTDSQDAEKRAETTRTESSLMLLRFCMLSREKLLVE